MNKIPKHKIAAAEKLLEQAKWNKKGTAKLVQVADDVLQLQPGHQLIYAGEGDWSAANAAFAKTSASGQQWKLL